MEKMWLWACVSDDWRLSMFAAGKKLIIGSEEWRDGFKVAVSVSAWFKFDPANGHRSKGYLAVKVEKKIGRRGRKL